MLCRNKRCICAFGFSALHFNIAKKKSTCMFHSVDEIGDSSNKNYLPVLSTELIHLQNKILKGLHKKNSKGNTISVNSNFRLAIFV